MPSLHLLLTLTLTVTLSLTSVVAGEADDSPVTRLIRQLSPAMEEAVSSALSRWQQPPPSESCLLQTRLEAVERDLAELRLSLLEKQITSKPEPLQGSKTEPEPEPTCERSGRPLLANQTLYQRPALLACARSCLQLRNQGDSPQDGVYWFTGMPVPVLCDFSHDGGGWTLLLTAVSRSDWDTLSVLGRNQGSPSLVDNYSVLHLANYIRDLGSGDRFAYRIEAQAELARQQWGGVWFAPRGYSFVHETASQTNVAIVRRFNTWSYKNSGIERRMPWVNMATGQPAVLTTSASASSSWWGTMVTFHGSGGFDHSPWIHLESERSGTVLYWLREEVL